MLFVQTNARQKQTTTTTKPFKQIEDQRKEQRKKKQVRESRIHKAEDNFGKEAQTKITKDMKIPCWICTSKYQRTKTDLQRSTKQTDLRKWKKIEFRQTEMKYWKLEYQRNRFAKWKMTKIEFRKTEMKYWKLEYQRNRFAKWKMKKIEYKQTEIKHWKSVHVFAKNCTSSHSKINTLYKRDCLIGLVLKAPASGAEDPGFESRLCWDFSGVR